ncbi:hypothetical protein JB92DRAFT_339875 [Gautieria morchelliformis]|nr:hypothetical protein JB92DRAFT_339875 [Gautieria morchelliformis]
MQVSCKCTGVDTLHRIYPITMTPWGKVRIANGGDKVPSCSAMGEAKAATARDTYFVRGGIIFNQLHLLTPRELMVKTPRRANEPRETVQMFDGQLEVTLPRAEHLNIPNKRRSLVACVEPCNTEARDTTREVTTHHWTATGIFIDIQAIGRVVGRVKRGNN